MSQQQQENNASGVSAILRNPGEVAQGLCECSLRKCFSNMMRMALVAALGIGVFGFAMGMFVDWQIALVDAAKTIGIAVFSFCLCLPMLYVSTNLAGCTLSFGRICGIGLLCLSALGCIYAALAPITWLFAVSSESVVGMVSITFVMSVIAWCFVRVPINAICSKRLVPCRHVLYVWFAVLFVVSLQMVTVMRPMLSRPEDGRHPAGKCFFLRHFAKLCMAPANADEGQQ